MENMKLIESKAEQAYSLLETGQLGEACDVFLDVWESLKELMQQRSLINLDELQAAYPWSDFVTNWVQDFEQELHNAGLDNPAYFEKRITYCFELLERSEGMDSLLIENTRRALADSFFATGKPEECDRLYRKWLDEDPAWGWGYIGWSDCYQFGDYSNNIDHMKAEQIIRPALTIPDIRDRLDVLERALDIYLAIDDFQKAEELKREIKPLLNHSMLINMNQETLVRANIEHIGRNDPCPCGSGKKYKKCCGR